MESAVSLAARLMSEYEDSLPLKQICDEILAVLLEGGLRDYDPVPIDLAREAQHRLALLAADRVVSPAAAPGASALPRQRRPMPA
jgi:hypothetical protein